MIWRRVLSWFAFLVFVKTGVLSKETEKEAIDKPVKFTASNHHALLLTSDPWILAFIKSYSGQDEKDLVSLAKSLAGGVRIGFVDMKDPHSEELLKAKDIHAPEIHVYKYGIKNELPVKVFTLKKAVEVAEDSFPDRFTAINERALLLYYKQQMEDSDPQKFPIIWFTDNKHVPGFLRSSALMLDEIFSFAKFMHPTEETMASFEITTVPKLLTLNHLNRETGEFQVIVYDERQYGKLNATGVLHYLISVISEIGESRHKTILKRLLSGERTDANDVMELDRKGVLPVNMLNLRVACADSMVGICVFVFLDGKDKNDIEFWKVNLNRIRKSDILKFHHIRYLWVNSTCHRPFVKHFGVKAKKLPQIVAVKRDANKFAELKGSHSYDKIRNFILSILDGTAKMKDIGRFPSVDDDCREKKKTGKPCKGQKCAKKKTHKSTGPSLSRQEL